MIYKVHNIKFIKISAILFLILTIVLNSGSVISKTSLNYITDFFLYVSLFFGLLYLLIFKPINLKVDLSLFIFMTLSYSILLSIIYNFSYFNFIYSLKILLVITFAFIFTKLIRFKSFIKGYILVLSFLTIVSLMSLFIIIVFGSHWLPIIENGNNVSYSTGLIFNFFNVDSNFQYKNMSVFWEPGVYASFLNIGLIFESYFKKNNESKLIILLFSIGILSTQSSAGYALLLLYVAMRLFEKRKYNYIVFFLFVITSFSLYFFMDYFVDFLLNWNYEIFYKFFSNDNITTGTRLNSPLLNYFIFMESPFFGEGFYNADEKYIYLMEYTKNIYYVVAQTSTSGFLLASLGILGSIYTIAWITSILKVKDYNVFIRLIMCTVFLLIINKEPHTTILVSYCILFYFLSYTSHKNEVGNE